METQPPGFDVLQGIAAVIATIRTGEPTPDALITTAPDPTAPLPLSHDELELRSEIARHLRPSAFPAARDDLLLVADEERASDEVLRLLASLPRDIEFHQVSDVWRALGGEVEHRSTEELELPVGAEIDDDGIDADGIDDDGIDAVEIDAVEIEIDVIALGEATGEADDVGVRDALVSETEPPDGTYQSWMLGQLDALDKALGGATN